MVKLDNKGFTLVELMATIVLLSIITGIASISITAIINNSKEKDYELLINEIKDAVELTYLECKGSDLDTSSDMCFMLGDANRDLVVDARDATWCSKYVSGMIDDSKLVKFCDVNGDGIVTSDDSSLIAQYEVELINQFIDGKIIVSLGDLVKYGYIKGNAQDDDGHFTLVNTNDQNDISECKIKYDYSNGKINIEAVNPTGSCPTEY